MLAGGLLFYSVVIMEASCRLAGNGTIKDIYGAIPRSFQNTMLFCSRIPSHLNGGQSAPSVVRDSEGIFWLACRMRSPELERGLRGYEIRILRSEDGIHFQKVYSIKRDDVPIPGFERPALQIDPIRESSNYMGVAPGRVVLGRLSNLMTPIVLKNSSVLRRDPLSKPRR